MQFHGCSESRKNNIHSRIDVGRCCYFGVDDTVHRIEQRHYGIHARDKVDKSVELHLLHTYFESATNLLLALRCIQSLEGHATHITHCLDVV